MAFPPKNGKKKLVDVSSLIDSSDTLVDVNDLIDTGEKKNGGGNGFNGLGKSTSQLPLPEDNASRGTSVFDNPALNPTIGKTSTLVTPDGAEFSIINPTLLGNSDEVLQGLQHRILTKTATPQDVEVLSKASGKSINATNAYLNENKDAGASTEFTEDIVKTKQDIANSINILNKNYGTKYNPDDILSSPEKSSQFLQQVKAFRKNPIDQERQAFNEFTDLSHADFNVIEDNIANNIKKLTVDEAFKAGLSNEQTASILHQRLDPVDYARSQEMRKPKNNAVPIVASLLSPVAAGVTSVNKFLDLITNKEEKNKEALNAEQGQYELEANRALRELAIEKKAQGIVNKDETLIAEANQIIPKIKNENDIINSRPLLIKQKMADYVNQRFAQDAGILEGTKVTDKANKLTQLFGINTPLAKKYLKEGGFYDNPAYKDYVDDVAEHPKTYFADNSPFGSVPNSFLKPFISIFNTVADLTGARTETDRHAENVRSELFPEQLTKGVKEDIAFDVAGHHFGMNVANTINSTANLAGYMAIAAGTGAVGSTAGLSANASARAGAWASFGMDAVDSGLKEADKMGLTPAQAWVYAGMKGTMMAEGGKLLEFGKAAVPSIKGVNEELAKAVIGISDKTITKDAAKEILDGVSNKWINGLAKYGIGTAKGAGVMAGFGVGDSLIEIAFGDENVKPENILPEAANAYFNGLFTMGILGSMGLEADIKNAKNSTYKGMLSKIVDNHDAAQDVLKIGLEKDLYTEEQYNKKVQILNTGIKSKATLDDVLGRTGIILSPEQKSVWVANKTAEQLLREEAANGNVDEKDAKKYTKQADNLLEQSTQTLDGLTFNKFLEPEVDLYNANVELRQAQTEFADNGTIENEANVLSKKDAVDKIKFSPNINEDGKSKKTEDAQAKGQQVGVLKTEGVGTETAPLTEIVKPFIDEVTQPIYKTALQGGDENTVNETLKEVAQQANASEAEKKGAISVFGENIVKIAQEKFPNENVEINKEGDLAQLEKQKAKSVEPSASIKNNAIVKFKSDTPELKDVPLNTIEENLDIGDTVHGNISGEKISGKVTNVGVHKGQIVVDITDQNGNDRFLYSKNIERIEPKQKEVERLTTEQNKRYLELINKDETTGEEMSEMDELGKMKRGEIPNPSKELPTTKPKQIENKEAVSIGEQNKNKYVNLQSNEGKEKNISTGQNESRTDNTQTSAEKEKSLTAKFNEVSSTSDIIDPYDRALQHFAGDGKINPSEIERIFGSKADKGARISLIKNDAPTIDKLAHQLWESDPSGKFDTQDYANAIEKVLREYTSKSAMQKDFIERYDFETAAQKYYDQFKEPEAKEAIDKVSVMSNDEINHLLQMDADKASGQQIQDFIDNIKPEIKGEKAPPEPPKPPIENGTKVNAEDDGRNELKEMALNIPNEGELKEYASKGTIEKYHRETPENEQGIIVQELTPALKHGENMIDKAKEVFGVKDYVDKTLQFIEDSKIPVQSKALMYISLENDLARQKLADPNNLDIQKQQNLVRSKSQAFLRESSLAINFGKLRKIGEVGYDVSKVTDNFFSAREKEEKGKVEKSIEANADTINKEAENAEAAQLELEQKINEAVESEIAKIHEKLSPEKRRNADKAVAALENFQKKIRSKTYDATIGIPVAIIDAGITVIKRAIKAGVKVADAIDLGIQHIKEKYGKEWNKEGEFKSDMIEGFRDSGIKKEASGTPNQIIKRALIESGFGREITVTINEKDAEGKAVKKDGKPVKVKEQRNILDWKKLAGEEGSIERMKENVSSVLEKQGYSKEEIADIQKDLIEQYNDLRASVIEHSLNELNKRNQKVLSAEQKSAAKKLAELYNYGLFEKDPAQYDVLLAKAVGIDRLNPERFRQAHDLGRALEVLYSTKFNGRKLNDLELKTAIQQVEEKMRILLHDEAGQHGNTSLKIADMVRTYMDATQRMILNNLSQAVQNPLSGFEQTLISSVDRLFDNSSTKELKQQKRKLAASVYKDMILSGSVNYGDVNTTFVSRGNLDAYISKMSDSKLFHAIASTIIGKTTLDAADSYFKAKLTEQKFTYNLIKVLTQNRLVDGKMIEGMKKEDAVNYVSEKLTGQSFEAAQKTAKEIIAKVNGGSKKIVGDSEHFANRLANDIVKAALVNGNVITTEQVTQAYNAAYKSAGRSLGHVANNPISEMVQSVSAKIEKRINDAIKDKEYKKAAFLTYQSVFFRNLLNPFLGGGTNWVVLKLEKNGLGLASGLYNGGRTKLDLTSEAGLRNAEKALYEEARDRDAFMRGAIGGTVSLLTAMLWFGVVGTDDYRKWRNKNKWATRYLDNITPEAILATMAARNKELGYYVGTLLNKNDAYDKSAKTIKSVDNYIKGKEEKALGQLGEAVGGNFGVPIPWRLVRDAQNIWLGAEGKEPYKVSSKPSQSFWDGALKAGMVDYIKNNPSFKK